MSSNYGVATFSSVVMTHNLFSAILNRHITMNHPTKEWQKVILQLFCCLL